MNHNIKYSLISTISLVGILFNATNDSYANSTILNELKTDYMLRYDNTPTNKPVSINFESDDNKPKRIKLPNGNYIISQSISYVVNKNGDYTFEYEGYDGGLNSKTISIDNIDNTPPKIKYSVNYDTDENGNKIGILNVEAIDDDSGIEYLQSWDGTIHSGKNNKSNTSDSHIIKANGNFFYIAVDNAGNISSRNISVFGLARSSFASGVDKVQYKLSGDTVRNWTSYNDIFTITTEGTTTIEAKATDKAGNVSDIASTTVKIDKTNPFASYSVLYNSDNTSATINVNSEDLLSGIKNITYNNGTVVNGTSASFNVSANGTYLVSSIDKANNISITSVVVDKINSQPYSGIKSVEYRLQGATTQDWTSYTTPFKITNEGVTTVEGRVTDNAGNTTTSTILTIKIDKTIPNVVSSIIYNQDNTSASVDVTFTDALSGVKHIVDINGNVINSSRVNFTVTQNGHYIVSSIDKAGNLAFHPIIVDGLTTGEYNSGISRIQYKLSGATTKSWTTYTDPITLTKEGTTTVTARSYDNAGNVSSEVSLLVKIDKTKPSNNQITIIKLD